MKITEMSHHIYEICEDQNFLPSQLQMSSDLHKSACICKSTTQNFLLTLLDNRIEIRKTCNLVSCHSPSNLTFSHPWSPVINDRIVQRSYPRLSAQEWHNHVMVTTVSTEKGLYDMRWVQVHKIWCFHAKSE